MHHSSAKIKLGILGGGQLSRMMALKSYAIGIEPYAFCAKLTDPAAQVTPFAIRGKITSRKDLKKFLKKVDLAIFENEFLDIPLLKQAATDTKASIHPKPQIMKILQDRLSQKKLLQSYNIPTVKYVKGRILRSIHSLIQLFPKGVVLKKRRHGYDGYGTRIVKDLAQNLSAQQFITNNIRDLIAEEFLPFRREMAIILVRNKKQQIIELPLVETYQENNCCRWVKGPCQHKQKNSLIKKLKNMMHKIDYEGVMAFELFETQQKSLLVNEIAPRVHNSGHYSLDALSENQFSLHIKAVLNWNMIPPLLNTQGFAMLNLLGWKTDANHQPSSKKTLNKKIVVKNQNCLYKVSSSTMREHIIQALSHFNQKVHTPIYLHWYGKAQSWSGRKMGHLNSLGRTPNEALNQLIQFQKKHIPWQCD